MIALLFSCGSHFFSRSFVSLQSAKFLLAMMKSTLATLFLLVASVSAHGNITSPLGRLSGPAMAAACGQAAVDAVTADGTIPLENITPETANCK